MGVKDFYDEIDKLKAEAEELIRIELEEHKCYTCIWGNRVTERKYLCTFSRCIKGEL